MVLLVYSVEERWSGTAGCRCTVKEIEPTKTRRDRGIWTGTVEFSPIKVNVAGIELRLT